MTTIGVPCGDNTWQGVACTPEHVCTRMHYFVWRCLPRDYNLSRSGGSQLEAAVAAAQQPILADTADTFDTNTAPKIAVSASCGPGDIGVGSACMPAATSGDADGRAGCATALGWAARTMAVGLVLAASYC